MTHGDPCPICLEPLRSDGWTIFTTVCGHAYHALCFRKYCVMQLAQHEDPAARYPVGGAAGYQGNGAAADLDRADGCGMLVPCPVCRHASTWAHLRRRPELRLPPWARARRRAWLRARLHQVRRWLPVVNSINALALAVIDCLAWHTGPQAPAARGSGSGIVVGMRLHHAVWQAAMLVYLWRNT